MTQQGDTATTYCENLELGGHSDWRLPTVNELSSLIDFEYAKSGVKMDDTFKHNNSKHEYWTATQFTKEDFARTVSFASGELGTLGKSTSVPVRCVRDGEVVVEDITADTVNEVVNNDTTKLVWQDSIDVADPVKKGNWDGAIAYCEGLSHAGRSDWRLPNVNELTSILDYGRPEGSIYKIEFQKVRGLTYWASTSTLHSGLDKGFVVSTNVGNTYAEDKIKEHNVICVADKQ